MNERRADSWEGRSATELAHRWGAPDLHLFATVGSTNDVARRLGSAGAAAGTVVLAEEQVTGRGRAGRSWASPPGLGLWFSVAAAPVGGGDATLIPLLVGLASAAALDEFLPPPGTAIKWPNDLWARGRKLGGILCETSWEGARPGAVVAGVGLNLLHTSDSFPAEIRPGATSIRIECGREVSRLMVADRVIPAVLAALTATPQLTSATLDLLARKDVLRGQRVRVTDPMTGSAIAEGHASGIRADGALLVRDPEGTEHCIRSGTVRICA